MSKALIYATLLSTVLGVACGIFITPYTRLEPNWIDYPAIKVIDSNLGEVLSDIESHLPNDHPYREVDKVTWGHEGTHGINSYIRNKYPGNNNGFYCLNDRAVVLPEPHTTLSNVARYVPNSLQGMMYRNYIIDMQDHWNNQPLYIFDEWIAYTNGTAVGLDLAKTGHWTGGQRWDTVQFMLEFNVLALCLAYAIVDPANPTDAYDDTSNFKALLRWNLRRTMMLLEQTKQYPQFTSSSHDAWLQKLRTSPDAEELRTFSREYLGSNWTNKFLGF